MREGAPPGVARSRASANCGGFRQHRRHMPAGQDAVKLKGADPDLSYHQTTFHCGPASPATISPLSAADFLALV
jgi:hypothetical protein